MKYIFEVTIKSGCRAEEYIEAWEAESEIIQRQPGARGTRLHRRIDQPDKFLAIATWESKELRDKALASLEANSEIMAIRQKHEPLVDFQLLGEFEDPEWEVMPK
jgi:heme-degrading monooxygenase HmoA